MKRFSSLISLLCLGILLSFQSCVKDQCVETVTVTQWTPIYKSYEEARNGVQSKDPITLKDPGKIFFYGNYLLINEKYKGVHVINNIDPANPQKVSFIEIPGAIDVAVRESILYADSGTDLVAIDISDPTNARQTKRLEDVLPYPTFDNNQWANSNLGVVVGWDQQEIVTTRDINCDGANNNNGGAISFEADASASSVDNVSNNPNTGQGGSLARFAISQKYLYVVSNRDLLFFDINDRRNPTVGGDMQIGWGIETVYPYKDKLFIGSNNGMFIYDVANPNSPEQLGTFAHVTSCDPVVANDEYAYVTLRSGNNCRLGEDRLDVLDIKDLRNPTLEKSYEMNQPFGLGIDKDLLFVCDEGLKVYNTNDPLALEDHLIKHYKNLNTYDVIPFNNILMVIGEDGLYQYSYEDAENIFLVSKILVGE